MTAIRNFSAILSIVAVMGTASMANAAMTPEELDRLGKTLSPTGAEMAGNKDGTIPAWTGGMTKPPAGWKPEMGYADPFADEKPLFVINANNADQYRDKLSVGAYAMLKKYPDKFMAIYPTHRTFALPPEVYAATKANAAKATLDGEHLNNYTLPGVPFPVPKNGMEAIYNAKLRYFGGYHVCADRIPVSADGEYFIGGVCEETVQGQNMEEIRPNNLFNFYLWFTSPASLEGTIYLVLDPIDYSIADRQAWLYNAGQRRVRRAPDVCCDATADGDEGMRTNDDYWGFNGRMDSYDWKLVGKREIYVPYNAYKLNDPKLKYADFLEKGMIKSDVMRYELHRVWVVEATLKPGKSHIYAKRVFYIDEDSQIIALSDEYDGRGNIWRVGLFPLMEAYDVPLMMQANDIYVDLISGSYEAMVMTNEQKQPAYQWNIKGKWADYSVDAIRRRGTK